MLQLHEVDVLLYFTFQWRRKQFLFRCDIILLIFLSELKNNGFRADEHVSTCVSSWCSNIRAIFMEGLEIIIGRQRRKSVGRSISLHTDLLVVLLVLLLLLVFVLFDRPKRIWQLKVSALSTKRRYIITRARTDKSSLLNKLTKIHDEDGNGCELLGIRVSITVAICKCG